MRTIQNKLQSHHSGSQLTAFAGVQRGISSVRRKRHAELARERQ
jgi:hypothetical protein